jgi:hypothetical protein
VWRKSATTAMSAFADRFLNTYVTVQAGILVKYRIYAPNLGFTKQRWKNPDKASIRIYLDGLPFTVGKTRIPG